MSTLQENLIKQSILRHSRIDICEPRSRTVSFSEESKQEDGDFILFPDHVMYPREKEFETKWKNFLLNRKSYTIIFGAAGCIYSASFRYFNGTISTMEKRFKISSRNIAVISSGNDISQVFASLFLTYYATGKNKPRWMSVSLYAMAFYCVSYFLKMLGPAVGYSIASFSLSYYIDPTLNVSITPSHSQWLGCWWLGWILIAFILTIFGYLVGLFPKKLTTEKVQENAENHTQNRELSLLTEDSSELMSLKKVKKTKITKNVEDERELSLKDFWNSLKRLLSNKILMYNNLATVFYLIGSIPYWMFAPKYFETEFRQTSAEASFKIGTISYLFSGLGVLVSGIVITKFKPRARYLAGYNILTASITVLGLIANYYMGCQKDVNPVSPTSLASCNDLCNCDFVKYTPICGSDNHNYISACHAGCTSRQFDAQRNVQLFTNCSCIEDDQNFAYEGPCPVDCNH
ncbi:solute carrier organic anion transporter family member 74D-like [Culicoides brevitarsis]|uniref:solute carrier organic anion transporter family member 74D-like n=1 Tax=Culicoides brevitarsis TaxID=469753 RepID=UPI00307B59D7